MYAGTHTMGFFLNFISFIFFFYYYYFCVLFFRLYRAGDLQRCSQRCPSSDTSSFMYNYVYIYVYSSRRIEYLLYSRFRHQSRPVRGHSHGRGQPFLESGRRYRLGHIDEFFLRGTAQKESRITYRNPHFRVNVVAPDPNKRVHAVYCFTTVYIYLHIEYCSCGLFELGKIIVW